STRRCSGRRGRCSRRTCATCWCAVRRRRRTCRTWATASRRTPTRRCSHASCGSPTVSVLNPLTCRMTDADRAGRPRDVVVVGGGVAGLTVARDLARAGVDVAVLEAEDHLGGTVAAYEVAGLRLDGGAESFATRTRDVADLLGELGLGDDIVTPAAPGAWVQLPDDVAPLPREAVLGIPGSPWAADVRRVIGVRGALRAGVDRLLPGRVGLG